MSKSKKKASGSQASGKRGTPTWPTNPFDYVIIGIDTTDGPEHHLFDGESNAYDAEGDRDMIANVRALGIIKPIRFMRDGDRMIVVDGRTRVRWARCAAKLQKAAGEVVLEVPGIPIRGDERTLYGVSRAAQRHRPDDSPLSNARNAQRLIGMGSSEADAAVYFGVSLPTLREWLKLLDLDPKVQRLVEKGMAVGAAAKLAKLPRSEQVARVAQITAGGDKPTARAVTNKLREASGKPAVETPAQKLKRIERVISDTDENINRINNDTFTGTDYVSEEGANLGALNKIRAILHRPTNGVRDDRPSQSASADGEVGFG